MTHTFEEFSGETVTSEFPEDAHEKTIEMMVESSAGSFLAGRVATMDDGEEIDVQVTVTKDSNEVEFEFDE